MERSAAKWKPSEVKRGKGRPVKRDRSLKTFKDWKWVKAAVQRGSELNCCKDKCVERK